MRSWCSLTVIEQTLMSRAMSQHSLAGSIQHYGTALRWAGAEDAPRRSYTQDEQIGLIPQVAAAALDLAELGLVTVQEMQGSFPQASDTVLTGMERQEVLADPANWLWNPSPAHRFTLASPEAVRNRWLNDVYPTADTSGLPTWTS